MKLLVLAAAAAVAAGALAPTAASADRWHHDRWRTKRVCTTHWYHGHRVRRCRNVRVRW